MISLDKQRVLLKKLMNCIGSVGMLVDVKLVLNKRLGTKVLVAEYLTRDDIAKWAAEASKEENKILPKIPEDVDPAGPPVDTEVEDESKIIPFPGRFSQE